MKRQPRILAGTALGLLMASAPLGAFPLQGSDIVGASQQAGQAPVVRVQAACDDSAENCAQTQQAEPEQRPRKHKRESQQAEPAPAEQAAPAQAEEATPPAEPEQKPRKQRRKDQQAEPAPAEQAAPTQAEEAAPAAEPEQKPRRKKEQKAEPTQAEQAPAQPEQPAEQAAEPKSKKEKLREFMKKKQGGGEEAAEPKQAEQPKPAEEGKPAEQAAPAEGTAPKPETKPAQAEQAPAQGEKPAEQAGEPKTKKEKLREFLKKKQGGGEETAQPEQAEQPKPAEEGKPAEQAAPGTQEAAPEQKAGEQAPAKNAEGGKQATQPELPADTKQQAMPKSKNEAEAKPLPKNAAPLPDSAKKAGAQAEGQAQQAEQPAQPAEQSGGQTQQAEQPKGEAEALPQSDSAAQTSLQKIDRIESVDAVEGKRIDADQWREERRQRREERRQRDKIDVVKEFGDRTVVKYGDNIYVDNRDANERLERGARDSYVEELPRNFTRYTIVKDNGTRVVTIRNADGDIVRRSRIMPDDREVVLYYVPETYYDRIESGYVDAGADLPPLRLTIPADEYILDAETAEPEDYYTYLDAPPVEPVERIYSVDEVVHSARIRDKVRRIDLDTITFDTGSAEIGEAQAAKLEALGDAISKILKQNPAETFLIEGHTDAVGSDESNLVLSDKRAESVAEALTSVFEIPAENLTTQGYGEKYLKVNTEGENRENRRVAVRRITPLVSPVASNNK